MRKREQIYDSIEDQLQTAFGGDSPNTLVIPYLSAILEVLIDIRDLYEIRSA